jgi:hypothetical protein
MKRNTNLQALSRDHHLGLLLAWKIRQGLKFLADLQIIADYIAYFSATALFPHFEEEEKQILTCLEELLNAEQLGEIGIAIDSNYQPFKENFQNEFWKKDAN